MLSQRHRKSSTKTRSVLNNLWYVYHRRAIKTAFTSISEIQYSLCGDKIHHSSDTPDRFHDFDPLRFQYCFQSGRAIYQLFRNDECSRYYQVCPPNLERLAPGTIHPFALHLVFIYKGALARGMEHEEFLRRLLSLEKRLLKGQSRVTAESAQDTKFLLQTLHSLSREMIAGENVNRRDLACVNGMLRDLDRVRSLVYTIKDAHPFDEQSHQRLVDGFLCLKTFCEDREQRLGNRLRRVENLIGLVSFLANAGSIIVLIDYKTYNLMANRDSVTSQTIATESTSIAHGARQDSYAMKTIAVLTMFFLPATFISSLLGTNLLALDTSVKGNPELVVSELWWIYLVSAVPLTLFTLLVWWLYLQWLLRARNRRLARKAADNSETLAMRTLSADDIA